MTNMNPPEVLNTSVIPRRVKYIRSIDQIKDMPDAQRRKLKKVAREYAFRANDYYLGLINWNDPDDPIKQLIIPRIEELNGLGRLDASNEAAVTVARGVQHKYPHTCLLYTSPSPRDRTRSRMPSSA